MINNRSPSIGCTGMVRNCRDGYNKCEHCYLTGEPCVYLGKNGDDSIKCSITTRRIVINAAHRFIKTQSKFNSEED